MTNDGLTFTTWFFSQFWRFFTCFHIPGTGMTPAAFFLFLMFASLSLKVVTSIINGSSAPPAITTKVQSIFRNKN